MSNLEHRFIGALATNVLVGRGPELAAIAAAVHPTSPYPSAVLAFIAPGGIGKTRLLQDTYTRLGGPAIDDDPLNQPARDQHGALAHPNVICLPLIDVADPILHRKVPFFRHLRKLLRKVLPPAAATLFHEFDQAITAYHVAREQAQPYAIVQQRIDAITTAFAADYHRLTATTRVVWLIDTMEQLYGISESIEAVLQASGLPEHEIGQTTYDWLTGFIGAAPANTVFLLVGRPTPSRWHRDINQLGHQDLHIEVRELQEFTPAEVLQYFQLLAAQLRAENLTAWAKYLDAMLQHPERAAVMAELTNGNPIRLALYLDMVASGGNPPTIFRMPLQEIHQLSAAERARLREQVDELLLDYIEGGIGHPDNAVLGYLLVSRRGINAERLQKLWEDDFDECQQILNHLSRLSFVKTRYNKAFLHDELYAMHGRRLSQKKIQNPKEYNDRQKELKIIYSSMIEYCQQRVNETIAEINDLQAINASSKIQPENPDKDVEKSTNQSNANTSLNEPNQAEPKDHSEILRGLRNDLPRYQAELLHYHLYLNPKKGFYEIYYMLAEQAYMGQDIDLDGYLQSELEVFFFGAANDANQRLTGLDDHDWAQLRRDVAEERIARWVKRIIQFNKVIRAQRFAVGALHAYEPLIAESIPLPPGPRDLFSAEVDAYRCFAAILKGEPIGKEPLRVTLDQLKAHIETLETAVRSIAFDPPAATRWLNTIAQCYLYHGYGYASIGSFRRAITSYDRAKRIVRHTGHEALHAEINNDYSRVLGELGLLHEAEGFCREGEKVRRRLGFDYAVGLSLNTRALIDSRNNRPSPAIRPATDALALFRQLNNPRGIVLAIKQLAEAKRRVWLFDPPSQPITLLDDAHRLLLEALEVVEREQLAEDIRAIEIELELGCLHRDRLLIAPPAARPALRDEAMTFFDQAFAHAQASELRTYMLDASINKAYVAFYASELDEATALLDAAFAAIPPRYRLSDQEPLRLTENMNLRMFYLLSKISNLRATIDAATNGGRLLEYRILGATYSQLFSARSWYFGEHVAQVQTLLDTTKAEDISDRINQARAIIERYHIRALEHYEEMGVPQVQIIIDQLTTAAKSNELDYLPPLAGV